MIDRLAAMWQALYPNSYVEPQRQLWPSYWYNKDDLLDVNTRQSSPDLSFLQQY